MNDPDINLFPALIEGVSTDFQDDVNPSKVFAEKEEPIRPDLTIHWSNWQTSESQPELTEKLVQEEIQRLAHLFSGDHWRCQKGVPSRRSREETFHSNLRDAAAPFTCWLYSFRNKPKLWHPRAPTIALYADLCETPGASYSIDPGYWLTTLSCLNSNLQFTSRSTVLVALMAQLVWRHSCGVDRLPVVVRFLAGPWVRLKTVGLPKGNGLGPKKKHLSIHWLFFLPVASWLSPGRSTRSICMEHVLFNSCIYCWWAAKVVLMKDQYTVR